MVMRRKTFLQGSQPLTWSSMSRPEQRTTSRILREHGQSLPVQAASQAERLRSQQAGGGPSAASYGSRASRLETLAADLPSTGLAVSLKRAAQHRVEAVKVAAHKRMPSEELGGLGFYFGAHRELEAAAPDLDPVVRAHASSALSAGTTPDRERAAFAALAQGDVKKARTYVSSPKSVEAAQKVLAGETVNPLKRPKQHAYGENIALPASASEDEEAEYMLRGGHVGRVIRGEVPVGQEVLDLFGQRKSTSGVLNPDLETPQDTWKTSMDIGWEANPRLRKGIGDIPIKGGKTRTRTTRSGQVVTETATSVPGAGIEAAQHAWQNEANRMAGRMLKDELRLGFDVPAMLTHEVSWAGVRRSSQPQKMTPGSELTADKEYNASLRSPLPVVSSRQIKGQRRLF